MKKFRILKTLVILCALTGMSGRVWGTTSYGTWRTDRMGLDNALTYSTMPIVLGNGDSVTGFAYLARGFHLPSGAATFQDVAFPIANDIYLGNSTTLTFTGDLTLSTTVIRAAGNFIIGSTGDTLSNLPPVLYLEQDTKLPPVTMSLSSSFTIDGLGHMVTFDPATCFALGSKTLLLRNMTIKGLADSKQFTGDTGTLKLQNCILDISSNTAAGAFTFGHGTAADTTLSLGIYDDVIVQGGGTFAFGGAGTLTINPYSTLYFDLDTTFSYWSKAETKVSMSDATATLHFNGATLKAVLVDVVGGQNSGLQLATGRLFLENKCTLNNGTNSADTKSIQLGNGTTDLTVKVLAGARVEVDGYVWHRPSA